MKKMFNYRHMYDYKIFSVGEIHIHVKNRMRQKDIWTNELYDYTSYSSCLCFSHSFVIWCHFPSRTLSLPARAFSLSLSFFFSLFSFPSPSQTKNNDFYVLSEKFSLYSWYEFSTLKTFKSKIFFDKILKFSFIY